MSERRQRRWWWWVQTAALVMAALAALSLALTVRLAQRALDNATEVVVRGNADVLLDGLLLELATVQWPVTSHTLARLLAQHEAEGLRYVALVDRLDHRRRVEAGTSGISAPFSLPGETVRLGQRVRVINALARVVARTEGRRDISTLVANETTPALAASMPGAQASRPYLLVEFEPPVMERLRTDLTRVWLVAAMAALVLIAFAFAWQRSTVRLSAIQSQAEADRRLVALGRASSVIAHELRNPLSALKGHAQLLAEDLPEPSRAKADRVVEGAERLERLTNVLLDFVREGPLEIRPLPPAELVERAIAGLPAERVQLDLARAPRVLNVDAERMSLALRNLVQNAVQASRDDESAVELRVAARERDVLIEVRDHGAGLAPGVQGQLFEPFVTTKARGTGLGLSIARRIAEQHRGTLTGASHAEGGAVFQLTVPLEPSTARRP
ncbi:MAG TPA: HAMP domain-containing sensor histidine kinase [Polyangiaceae bacterium]